MKEFISEVLGPKDDITHFEYSKKHNRTSGPAIIGLELGSEEKIDSIFKNQDSFDEFVNSARSIDSSNRFLPQINFILYIQ